MCPVGAPSGFVFAPHCLGYFCFGVTFRTSSHPVAQRLATVGFCRSPPGGGHPTCRDAGFTRPPLPQDPPRLGVIVFVRFWVYLLRPALSRPDTYPYSRSHVFATFWGFFPAFLVAAPTPPPVLSTVGVGGGWVVCLVVTPSFFAHLCCLPLFAPSPFPFLFFGPAFFRGVYGGGLSPLATPSLGKLFCCPLPQHHIDSFVTVTHTCGCC